MHQPLSQRVNAVLLVLGVNNMSYKLDELHVLTQIEEASVSLNEAIDEVISDLNAKSVAQADDDDEPMDCYNAYTPVNPPIVAIATQCSLRYDDTGIHLIDVNMGIPVKPSRTPLNITQCNISYTGMTVEQFTYVLDELARAVGEFGVKASLSIRGSKAIVSGNDDGYMHYYVDSITVKERRHMDVRDSNT